MKILSGKLTSSKSNVTIIKTLNTMKAIKYILTLVVIFFLPTVLFAQQTVDFEYDAAGNRVLRQVSTKKVTKTEIDTLFKSGAITEKITGDNLVKVYPNPTYGIINIEFPGMIDKSATYFLTDQHGRQVMIGKFNNFSNTIDITTQGRGVYYLLIKAPNIYQVYKIIKQ